MVSIATAAGLLGDFLGALLIAVGLLRTTNTDIARFSAAYWDGNVHLFRSLYFGRLEARFGIILLCLGFFLQLVGVVEPIEWKVQSYSELAEFWWAYAYGIWLVFCFYIGLRDRAELSVTHEQELANEEIAQDDASETGRRARPGPGLGTILALT